MHPLFKAVMLITLSLGKGGAFVKYEELFYRVKIPNIPVENPVGSGDLSLSGLAIGLAK